MGPEILVLPDFKLEAEKCTPHFTLRERDQAPHPWGQKVLFAPYVRVLG